MAGDVFERLQDNPVQRRDPRVVQIDGGRPRAHVTADARPLAEQPGLPPDRRHETEMIQDRRPERRRQCAERRQADVGQPGGGLKPINDGMHRPVGVLAERGDRGPELEPDARQELSELVVKRAREPPALLFAHLFGMRREFPQPPARLPEPGFHLPPLGHVAVMPHVQHAAGRAHDRHVVAIEDPAVDQADLLPELRATLRLQSGRQLAIRLDVRDEHLP